jgi:probable rRNA maturation factor
VRGIEINNQCEGLRFAGEEVAAALLHLDERFPRRPPPGNLSVVFLDEQAMGELHGRFLADPSPTDVITFPGDPAFGEAGEICAGAERADRIGRELGHDFAAELTLYLAHGWLHLAGYDDRTPDARDRMRAAERHALALLRAGPGYPAFALVSGPHPS